MSDYSEYKTLGSRVLTSRDILGYKVQHNLTENIGRAGNLYSEYRRLMNYKQISSRCRDFGNNQVIDTKTYMTSFLKNPTTNNLLREQVAKFVADGKTVALFDGSDYRAPWEGKVTSTRKANNGI